MSNQLDVKRSADRCVTQWNEPDPAPRTVLIRRPWAPDGIQAWEDAFLPLPTVVAVRWPMVSAPGGPDVLALDGDGRIRTDHRFIEAS